MRVLIEFFHESEESDILEAEIKRALIRFDSLSSKEVSGYFRPKTVDSLIEILTFVHNQHFTGKLYAIGFKENGTFAFNDGNLMNANCGDCKGNNAVAELLAMLPCSISLKESKVPAGDAIPYMEKIQALLKRAEFYYNFMAKYKNTMVTFYKN